MYGTDGDGVVFDLEPEKGIGAPNYPYAILDADVSALVLRKWMTRIACQGTITKYSGLYPLS